MTDTASCCRVMRVQGSRPALTAPGVTLSYTGRPFTEPIPIMYEHLLSGHNWMRWIILAVGIAAVAIRWIGVFNDKDIKAARVLGSIFTGFLDLQLLVGVLLYIYTPLRANAFANPSVAITGETGYLIFLHPILMILAIVLAHAAGIVAKKDFHPGSKRQVTALLLTLALLIVGFSIPWWRPLVRL